MASKNEKSLRLYTLSHELVHEWKAENRGMHIFTAPPPDMLATVRTVEGFVQCDAKVSHLARRDRLFDVPGAAQELVFERGKVYGLPGAERALCPETMLSSKLCVARTWPSYTLLTLRVDTPSISSPNSPRWRLTTGGCSVRQAC